MGDGRAAGPRLLSEPRVRDLAPGVADPRRSRERAAGRRHDHPRPPPPAARTGRAGSSARRPNMRCAASPPPLPLLVAWLAVTAPLSQSLQPIAAPSFLVLAADGQPIARRGAVRGAPVDVMTLPPHVGQAFIAIEDRRFFHHVGIDPWSIGRALFRNWQAGRVREGGSTISQQLAKTSFTGGERTIGPQGAGGVDHPLARSAAVQGGDPQPLPLQRLFRQQHLRPQRRRPFLLQRRARAADARPGGLARRPRQRAQPARPQPQPGRRPAPRAPRPAHDGRHRLHRRGRTPAHPAGAAAARAQRQPPDRNLFRRLDPVRRPECRPGGIWRAPGRNDARAPPPARRHPRLPLVGTRHPPGGIGGDAARRPDRGDAGRARLWAQPVQPRDDGAPPGGLDLQAVRLSRRPAFRAAARIR